MPKGLEANEADIQKRLNSYRKRFCNLTAFVQETKNRYSRWFNKKNNRRGTLWSERFESTLLETPKTIREAALQIELTAVTEGLASHPKDYPWCGYAQALGGSKRARRGLCRITGHPIDNWKIKGTQKTPEPPPTASSSNPPSRTSQWREVLRRLRATVKPPDLQQYLRIPQKTPPYFMH